MHVKFSFNCHLILPLFVFKFVIANLVNTTTLLNHTSDSYFSALERTLFLNHVPSDRHLEVWQVNCDVHRRGMELIKPGVKCCDIALELNEMYREKNLLQYKSFGYGHSFGVLSHYYGREAGRLL